MHMLIHGSLAPVERPGGHRLQRTGEDLLQQIEQRAVLHTQASIRAEPSYKTALAARCRGCSSRCVYVVLNLITHGHAQPISTRRTRTPHPAVRTRQPHGVAAVRAVHLSSRNAAPARCTRPCCGLVVRGSVELTSCGSIGREVCFSDVDGTLVHYPELMNRLGSIQESTESATGLVFINRVRPRPLWCSREGTPTDQTTLVSEELW
jgi:hypothetical protein